MHFFRYNDRYLQKAAFSRVPPEKEPQIGSNSENPV